MGVRNKKYMHNIMYFAKVNGTLVNLKSAVVINKLLTVSSLSWY